MMSKFFIVAAVAALATAIPARFHKSPEAMFEDFKSDHGKSYGSDAEENHRFLIFKENLAFIDRHNSEGHSYTVGVNQFADLTNEEFKALYVNTRYNRTAPRNTVWLDSAPVDSVDWRQHGAVTPVKNQGQCGSCWSFSTTGSVEGANAIANGKLVSLSEQQLVDCSRSFGNQGCNGGLMDNAFKYIMSNGGLDTEQDYPYTAQDGTCNKQKEAKHVVGISGYQDVPQDNEDQLAAAVAKGPVSVAIEADQQGFQMYHSGVFDGNCGHNLDHGVLVVGYTDDYWIVKNSWGASWGDKGFIMMKRGVSKQGICGIAM
jgi:C1A family cysteine protease